MAAIGEMDRVFEAHLHDYLANNGIRRADAEQVDATAVLDAAGSLEGEAAPPFDGEPGHPAPEFQLQLQQFLLAKGIAPQTVLTLTPDHFLESVRDSFPDAVNVLSSTEPTEPYLAAAHEDQAAHVNSPPPSSEPTKRELTPIDSVLADDEDLFGESPVAPIKTPVQDNSDSDYEDDEPIIHRRRGIAQKRPKSNLAAPQAPQLKTVQTSCLANIEPHAEALSITHGSKYKYAKFMNEHYLCMGNRLAAVCLTLVRADRSVDAVALAQCAVNIMGRECFEAMVVYHEQAEPHEADNIENAKYCLMECLDYCNEGYGDGPTQELRSRIIGAGMRGGW